jgi:hypothetical protein
MGYPFLLFGRRPNDWHTSVEHPYRVCFENPPDAAARLAIAKAFGRALADGAAEKGISPWRWNDAWAFFSFVEPSRDADDPVDVFFNGVESALRAVHRAAPLKEAVFEGVSGSEWGEHEWDAWTQTKRKNPLEAPAERGDADPAFDQALTEAIAAARAEQAKRKTQAPSFVVTLREIPATDWPKEKPAVPEASDEAKALLAGGKKIERYLTRGGVTVGLYKWGVRYVNAKGKAKSKATLSHSNYAWLSPDGSRLLISNGGYDAWRIALPSGDANLFKVPLALGRFDYVEVAHDQLLCGQLGKLYLAAETPTGAEQVAELEVGEFSRFLVACGGRLIVVGRSFGESSEIVAVGKGTLTRAAEVPRWVVDVHSTERELYVRDPNSAYEVTNVSDVLKVN